MELSYRITDGSPSGIDVVDIADSSVVVIVFVYSSMFLTSYGVDE